MCLCWQNLYQRLMGYGERQILIDGKAVDPSHLNQFFASISTDPDYSLDDVIDFSGHIDPPNLSPYTSNTNTEIHRYEIEPVLRKLKNTAPVCDYGKHCRASVFPTPSWDLSQHFTRVPLPRFGSTACSQTSFSQLLALDRAVCLRGTCSETICKHRILFPSIQHLA